MKNLTRAVLVACLGAAALPVQAATVAVAEAGVVQTASIAGELAGINTAIAQAGQVVDFGNTNILWVLGGGLIALSLVARRTSA